jgi:hypothetical protein
MIIGDECLYCKLSAKRKIRQAIGVAWRIFGGGIEPSVVLENLVETTRELLKLRSLSFP